MYRIKTWPATGRSIIAHFSDFVQTSKFNCANGRICGKRSAQTSISIRRKRQPRSLAILFYLAIGLSFSGILGCGGVVFRGASSGSTSDGTASLAATPSSVEFGVLAVGNSANQKISIVNTSSEAVQVTGLTSSN